MKRKNQLYFFLYQLWKYIFTKTIYQNILLYTCDSKLVWILLWNLLHSPCLPDFAPSDYYFQFEEACWKQTYMKVLDKTITYFEDLDKSYHKHGTEKLEHCWTVLKGGYVKNKKDFSLCAFFISALPNQTPLAPSFLMTHILKSVNTCTYFFCTYVHSVSKNYELLCNVTKEIFWCEARTRIW